MANANGWGDGASNNNIGWGKGADNAIGWGSVYSVSEAGATDIVGTPAVDPDAQAFITAAAITDPTQQGAINTLVVDLKGYSIWTKFKAIYPIVGGTAASHKFNLKDPRDLDAAFRLTFATGWTHSATGMTPNGTSAYADTFCSILNNIGESSHAFGVYSRTNNTSGAQVYGAFNNSIKFVQNNLTAANFVSGDVTQIISYTANPTTGLIIGTRRSVTDFQAYRAGVSLGTNTTNATGNIPAENFYLGARNNTGSPDNYSLHQLSLAFLSTGLTDTEAANFYTAVQAYQTTLSRNV
jgi:hypothetical protein